MKKFNQAKNWIIAAGMAIMMASCSQSGDGSKEQSSEQGETATQATSLAPSDAQQILEAYLRIKDDLVETNGGEAKAHAEAMVALITSDDELAKSIKASAEKIAGTDDTQQQRVDFNTLSIDMYALVSATSASESTIFKQYCPMAFNDKGAYWLSAEKEVNNPYFGDEMLHCGVVQEEL